jgi:hypothetical protein
MSDRVRQTSGCRRLVLICENDKLKFVEHSPQGKAQPGGSTASKAALAG